MPFVASCVSPSGRTLLAYGALLCAEPAYERSGALAPAQAFDPEPFLAALGGAGLTTRSRAAPDLLLRR